SHLEPADLLPLLAQSGDAEPHGVAGLEEDRRRLHAEGDTGRGAGGDEIARLEHEELRAVPDHVGDAEDHGLRASRLPSLAIALEEYGEFVHVFDLVFSPEPRADWPEGLRALAFGPLAAALHLEGALGDVVLYEVAGDHRERVLLG